ncbi:MAG: hypothetical protein QM751_10345 [Paludibacteraceae bacterium]
MKKIPFVIQRARFSALLYLIVIISVLISSCANEFERLSTSKPSWLGENIYKQLEEGYTDQDGKVYKFSTYLQLIEDLKYGEVLKLTGSKTLFVADDAAFERFYQSNSWGVKSYSSFSLAQKKLIFNTFMLDNAYLIELMSNVTGPIEDVAMRRITSQSLIDTISYVKNEGMPINSNWDYYRDKGMYLVKDDTPYSMLHFLQPQMTFKGITNEDFAFIFGENRNDNDAHIFGDKVVVRDITCKNGYLNILKDVIIPPSNMAEVIRETPETQIFSSILERYAAPFYAQKVTDQYKSNNLGFNDSIFLKKIFCREKHRRIYF